VSTASACVSMLFPELPLLERFEAAAAHGFAAVELWWPPRELHDAIVAATARAGVMVSLLTIDGGDGARGERGLFADPGRAERLRASTARAVELADRLSCTRLYSLIGCRRPGLSHADQVAHVGAQIARVADALRPHGLALLLEPVNATDNGPQVLARPEAVAELLDQVGRDNTGLLFDTYHAAHTELGVVAAFERVHRHVRHVHLSDWPGRKEPGAGEVDFAALRDAFARTGYGCTVGLEYLPSTPTTPETFPSLARAGLADLLPTGA